MKNKWLHLAVDKENVFGLICGLIMILLSAAMTLFHNEISNILLRDVFMILLLGFHLPLYYILVVKKKSLSVLGFRKKKLIVSLVVNAAAGISLLGMFVSKNTEDIVFNIDSLYAVTYILAAGIFEMIFIYGFLRYEFERAFGILPAIFMTAAFYSLHHAGFQPEFMKLFFVGIMYVTVFYFTYNIFAIFPLFWGVGAVWDVLVNSEAGEQLKNRDSFIIAILMLFAMLIIGFFIDRKIKMERAKEMPERTDS